MKPSQSKQAARRYSPEQEEISRASSFGDVELQWCGLWSCAQIWFVVFQPRASTRGLDSEGLIQLKNTQGRVLRLCGAVCSLGWFSWVRFNTKPLRNWSEAWQLCAPRMGRRRAGLPLAMWGSWAWRPATCFPLLLVEARYEFLVFR